MAIDPSINTQIQIKQNGDELVVGPAGTLTIEAGATVNGLSAVTTQTAEADLTDNSGGAAADGTIGAVTAPTALTDSTGGTADGTLSAVGATNGSDVSGTINNNFKELTTAQAANRTAIVALTDAVKEVATKVNAILAKLRLADVIDT